MGAIWLGSLPQVIRDAGLFCDVFPGWETRSRAAGGYESLLGIQIHHTASNAAPASDMAYMWLNSPSRPIGAIYLARDGRVTVGAAGATNTSGKGGPLATSRGTIPLDAANNHVISIEAANRGDGETWPDVQLDSYVRLVAALNKAYFGGVLNVVGDVHAHHEWTSRKIDPSGQSWYAWGRNKWNMQSFRSDVSAANTPPPVPTVPTTPSNPGEDTMKAIYYPGPAISHLTDVHFAAFESGVIRHASGPDTSPNVWGNVPKEPINGNAHFNQLARAAIHMSGAQITLLPE